MESDFSDFRNGEVAQSGSSVGLKSQASQVRILSSPQNDITWIALWSEEVLDLADQVAKGYGVVMTDEQIEAWADKLAWKCAQLND